MSKADEIISLKQAAEVTGYSKPWLGKLVEDGFITKVVVGKYKLGNVVQGALAAAKQVKQSAPQSKYKERVYKARAEGMELKNKIAARELVSLDESIFLIDRVLMPLKSDLLGLGARVTRDPELRMKIDAYINDVLQAAADRSFKMGNEMKSGLPKDEADPDEEFFSSGA
jgi:hypothetical protein